MSQCVFVHLEDVRLGRRPRGVVDHDVHTAPRVEHLGKHRLHVGLDARVARDRQRRSAGRLDRLRGLAQRIGAACRQDNPSTLACQPLGDAPTDAAARARHDGYFAIQPHLSIMRGQ